MEKINVAEILKDCEKGMELDCILFKDTPVYFHEITTDTNYPIEIKVEHPYKELETFFLNKYGAIYDRPTAKCVIFPKGKTTWEGFQRPFKDGDIVYTCNDDKDEYIFIFESITENTHVNSYLHIKDGYDLRISKVWLTNCDDKYLRFATEEEKQTLFQVIKDNGYKWNEETKTLEKLVDLKFKVGDVIQDIDTYKVKITEVNIEDGCYEYESIIAKGIGSIPFSEQDDWELVPNKFDITTLKPFESKVLVRDINTDKWIGAFYSHCKSNGKKFYTIGSSYYYQCIPYEGNEHLLDTTDDCDEYYKTWEI